MESIVYDSLRKYLSYGIVEGGLNSVAARSSFVRLSHSRPLLVVPHSSSSESRSAAPRLGASVFAGAGSRSAGSLGSLE